MKHVSHYIPQALANIGEKARCENSELRDLQRKREDAQAVGDLNAVKLFDAAIEALVNGGKV